MHNDVMQLNARLAFWSRREKIFSKWMPSKLIVYKFFKVLSRRFRPMKTPVLFRALARVFRCRNRRTCNTVVRVLQRIYLSKVEVASYTCCVPGCTSNNKRNPELWFYYFPNAKIRKIFRRNGSTLFHEGISRPRLAIRSVLCTSLEAAKCT